MIPLYFTIINILLVFFHRYTYRYYNLLLSSLIISFITFIMVYVTPKKLNIFNKFTLTGWKLKLIDFVFHHLVTLFVIVMYGEYYKNNPFGYATAITLIVILTYASLAKPYEVYKIEKSFVMFAALAALFIYMLYGLTSE